MPAPELNLLSKSDLETIHARARHVLEHVGVQVDDAVTLERLQELGAWVDHALNRARIPAELVENALAQAGKRYVLHGRLPEKTARFGYGEINLMASPGQAAWFDQPGGKRRQPLLSDVRNAAIVGDALEEITVVGGLGVPSDAPGAMRDVAAVAQLVKTTGKPTRAFPISARSSRYVLEIYACLAGGVEALRARPMTETLLDPISPFQFPAGALEIARVFIEYGQPVCVAPMALAGGTAPVTLAGAIVQVHAEALAGIVIVQALSPGHPVMYGGIPHILDPRSALISFGSPEQGLMAAAMAALAKHWYLPAYINVNLTDAKRLDLQAGLEKMSGLLMGLLAGADLFGHAGIIGADAGGGLAWLAADHLALGYARRVKQGFVIDAEHLAQELIEAVGPGGNFLAESHTARHFREELWLPGRVWDRKAFIDEDLPGDAQDFDQRLTGLVEHILKTHQTPELDPALEREIDRIVQAAEKELA